MDPLAVNDAVTPNDRPQKSDSGGHFDLDLLEATPGIEPGIAVLQTAASMIGLAGVRSGLPDYLTDWVFRRGALGGY